MVGRSYGRKVRVCHSGCLSSFKEDRRAGLIYPAYDVDGAIMGVEAASMVAEFCCYCGAHVPGRVSPALLAELGLKEVHRA